MAKLQYAIPPYGIPKRHMRGYCQGQQPHGSYPPEEEPPAIPVLRKLSSHRARGPAPDFMEFFSLTGLSLTWYRRDWCKRLAQAWKTDLSNAQRTVWKNLAATVTIENYKGVSKVPNGFQLFHHYNDFAAHLNNQWPPWDKTYFAQPILNAPGAWDPPDAPNIVNVVSSDYAYVIVYTDNPPYPQPKYTTGAWRRAPDAQPSSRPGQYTTAQISSWGSYPGSGHFIVRFNNVPGVTRLPLSICMGVRYLSYPNLVPGPLAWTTAYVHYVP